ncbi:MAG: hypothetical protein IJ789_03690 [Bacteroidales bacterium]|nr:hypothetical protein [Bacteroidales bacterium]
MKKTFIALACAFAVALGATSCDELDINDIVKDIVDDIDNNIGNVDLAISGAQGESPLAGQDSLKFKACVNGVVTDTIDLGDLADSIDVDTYHGVNTFVLGANISLTDNNVDLENNYPLIGIKTRDTISGRHMMSNPFADTNIMMNFDFSALITQGSDENLFGVMLSDTSWYVAYAGEFDIETYPEMGDKMKAKLNNVKAYYVCQYQLDNINDLIETIKNAASYNGADQATRIEHADEIQAGIEAKEAFDNIVANPGSIFSSLTFNGTVVSIRTDVQDFINQLNAQ